MAGTTNDGIIGDLMKSAEFESMIHTKLTDFFRSSQFKDMVRNEVVAVMKDMILTSEEKKADSTPDHGKVLQEELPAKHSEVATEHKIVDPDCKSLTNEREMIMWEADINADKVTELNVDITPKVNTLLANPPRAENTPYGNFCTLDTNMGTHETPIFEEWAAQFTTTLRQNQKPIINVNLGKVKALQGATEEEGLEHGLSQWEMTLSQVFKVCRNGGVSSRPFRPKGRMCAFKCFEKINSKLFGKA